MRNGILNTLKMFMIVLSIGLLSVLVISCDSGSGGGGNDRTPATIDQSSGESSVNLAFMTNELSDGLQSITDSFVGMGAEEGKAPITPLVKPILQFIERRIYDDQQIYATLGSESIDESCDGSGSISGSLNWDGPDNPDGCSDVSNLEGNITLTNCGEFYPFKIGGTCTFTINGPLCNPTSIDIRYTNYSVTSSTQPDYYSMDSFSLDVNGIQWNGDMITQQSLVLNGDLQGNIFGHEFSAEYYNYTTDIKTTNDFDFTVELSGSLTGGCLSGWVTFATDVPIAISDTDSCPSAGQLRLSGDGEMTVIFNPDGSVDIGDIHYDSCDDIGENCF